TVNSVKTARIPSAQLAGAKAQGVTGKYIAEVSFTVAKSSPLTRGVIVQERYRNLVGQRYLDVQQGAGSSAMLDPKQAIPVSQTKPAVDLTLLFQGFQPLFAGLDSNSINSLSLEIIQTLQGEGGSIES